ncbi:MAG: diguanylate cyclase [Bacillota bacterium]
MSPSFALLFIDLDNFKTITAHYGHAAGDKVLVTVAAHPKQTVHVSDAAATEGKIREIVEAPVQF